ncbi:MAG: hypothetical protein Q4C95_08795 [Planctomycetia bacterium]|nr:hypothetical protein [Planctomycetia bacterium]
MNKYIKNLLLTFLVLIFFIEKNVGMEPPTINATDMREPVYPVYFADFFAEEGQNLIHFQWRVDGSSPAKAVITDSKGNVWGEVPFPNDRFMIERREHFPDQVLITVVDEKNRYSESVEVDLNQDVRSLWVNPEHIEPITVSKQNEEFASFCLAKSGQKFIVNGVNYCVIKTLDHDTFEPEINERPAIYDPYDAESMLRCMKRNGYNTVRVFIKTGYRGTVTLGLSGPSDTQGIYAPYMDNFLDFLSRAAKYGIYVFPCLCENEMLSNDYFKERSGNANRQGILFSQKGIEAKQEYLSLFLQAIKKRNPKLLDSLLGIAMQNEFVFHCSEAPFNQLDGKYVFLDGSEYNMSDDISRRALANAAIQYYYRAMKQTLQTNAPGLLLAEGTFALGAVGKTEENSKGIRPIEGNLDMRYPMTAVELMKTDIDFLDLHIYRWGFPGSGEEVFRHFTENMKLTTQEGRQLRTKKPIIMGEFGSFKENEKTTDEAILFTKSLKNAALKDGFAGTCFWTIDCFEQKDIWNLMWENGKLLKALQSF